MFSFQDVPSADDVVAMTNLLDQMTSLLEVELTKSKDDPLPCLDLLLSENVLAHILATSRMPVSIQYFIRSKKGLSERK